MTRTRGRKKERRWRKGAKRGFEDLRSGYVCAHQKRNTLPLSPFRFEEKARAAGRKAQWDPANQPASEQCTHLPPDLPATCSSFLCWNFRSPTSCIEEFCQRMRECSREIADAAATFCDGVFCGGGREGVRQKRKKRREEKRDTVAAAAAAAAHALLSSQQFLKKSAATAPPPSLQQNQQQKTNIRCSITDDNSLLLHEQHHHHHHQ